jgi:hypothetical protein
VSLQNLIVGISGEKGAGKSTLLRQLAGEEPALALVDTLGEHEAWCPRHPGTPREQIADLAEPPDTFKWSFLLDPESAKTEAAHFNGLCRAAYRAGDLTFAIEECDRYSKAGSDLSGLKILYDYGRHKRVNVVWLTRNLVAVSRRLTSLTDVFYFFRQSEPLYVKGIEDRVGPEIALEVQNLPKFHYILCAKGQQPVRGTVSVTN